MDKQIKLTHIDNGKVFTLMSTTPCIDEEGLYFIIYDDEGKLEIVRGTKFVKNYCVLIAKGLNNNPL